MERLWSWIRSSELNNAKAAGAKSVLHSDVHAHIEKTHGIKNGYVITSILDWGSKILSAEAKFVSAKTSTCLRKLSHYIMWHKIFLKFLFFNCGVDHCLIYGRTMADIIWSCHWSTAWQLTLIAMFLTGLPMNCFITHIALHELMLDYTSTPLISAFV